MRQAGGFKAVSSAPNIAAQEISMFGNSGELIMKRNCFTIFLSFLVMIFTPYHKH